ncbi:MAG: DUF2313 domain-containing protein [Eubacteriales bacterium]|nr:DUF2313 domain-containing protein [Eubacteriales bacterium]
MMYGQGEYGASTYAGGTDQSGDQEHFRDLSRYVPQFVADLAEMAEIYRTDGYEIGGARYSANDLLDQCFVQTATWGLVLWEQELGIVTNYQLSYEQRRDVILAKLRGQETTTVAVVRRTAESFAGCAAEVIEDTANYCFIIKFVGMYGIPPNMQQLAAALEEIKPAHLGFSFQYRYVIWDELLPYTWDDLTKFTWDGLRVNRIDKFVRWQNLTDRSWSNLGIHGWDKVKSIKEAMT